MLSIKRRKAVQTPDQGALDIVHAYGEVLERKPSTPPGHPAAIFAAVYPDISQLPYPKNVIDAAITYLMERVRSEDEFEKLAGGRALLATYQDYARLRTEKMDADRVSLDEMNAIVADNKSRRALAKLSGGNQ